MTLKEKYLKEVKPELQKKRGYTSPMQVPKISKVVLNTGINSQKDKNVFTEALEFFKDITGQKPVTTKARLSVSNFKLRQGQPVGVTVTLRKRNMYNFLYKLINVGFPGIRDFQGFSKKAFDGSGNYNLGLTEQSIFTEVNMDKIKNTIGMNVTIVTTAQTDDEAYDLLKMLDFPFREN
ncbi:MAG: 50S ribosomal protein L5 [Verrucomicrobiota bacterium]|nr:50S ribosomal protein L5 [Verrucomicrobiota bacterium]